MTLTLKTLVVPLTVAEAKTAIYDSLTAQGVSTTTWKSGGTARTIIAGLSIVLAAFSRLQSLIAKSGFLSLAEKDWLTLVALHVYDVERSTGTFATGEVTLVNSGGGVYSGDAGDLIFLNTDSLKTYRNTASYSLGASATITVAVEAIEIGTDSNAIAAQINALVTTLSGVTVSNALALVGTDPESDTALRLRCSEKTGSLSPNGASDAYAYVARSAVRDDGVTAIGVTRVRAVADGTGLVDVYVATATGRITGTAGDPTTDLGAVNLAIQTQVVPLSVTATVQSATPIQIDVTYELWIRDTSGLTDALVESAVEDALLAYITDQPIGGVIVSPAAGKIYVSALETVIGAAVPGVIVKVAVTLPAADVTLALSECPMLGDIIVTGIHQVSGGVV